MNINAMMVGHLSRAPVGLDILVDSLCPLFVHMSMGRQQDRTDMQSLDTHDQAHRSAGRLGGGGSDDQTPSVRARLDVNINFALPGMSARRHCGVL